MNEPGVRPGSAVERPAPKRARHLMDPANPRVDRPNSASVVRVQTWVMSVLAVTTILHLAVGLLISAAVIDADLVVERVGLVVIAGAFGVVAAAAGLAIHRRPIASPWLSLGLVPALVGAVLIFAL
ncbi:hypothetical protein [Nocardioides sp. AX2bis]|uniref:hypothetical protein n=1 Tax=Nocardioides sp. AX2bis TaxID=2653157 RepID=UPI0012F1CE0D|nr:hypothetical protein [Nocardioides sp. AX2bis]VXB83358.1 conserved membrane hypothetical protein [Nocardioides sp. AX2bis]